MLFTLGCKRYQTYMEQQLMTSQKFTSMRKTATLILAVLIVSLGIQKIQNQITDLGQAVFSTSKKELDYIFYVDTATFNKKFSLALEDSDLMEHETVLNSLVGTLVKYSKFGIIEPYLAESYSVSEDRKVWSYKLREGLTCDDGTAITPETFVAALYRQLQIYSGHSLPIDFANLVGYQEFHDKTESKIKGIQFTKSTVVFEFTKAPQDLNEMLRMPYFGFWCPDNLSENQWNKTGRFVSSSAYSLGGESNQERIVLEKRKDWFSVKPESPERLNFFFANLLDFEKKSSLNRPFLLETSSNRTFENSVLENVKMIDGAPGTLAAMVLSPYKEGPFKDLNFRRYFLNKFRQTQPGSRFSSMYFYPSAKTKIQEIDVPKPEFKKQKVTLAYVGKKKSTNVEALEKILSSLFAEDGLEFEFVGNLDTEDNWGKRMLSDREFDIRLAGVATGATLRPFIVRMMFATRLGVSFPDPSGRILTLVEEGESKPFALPPEYYQRFNQILYEDASVIPFLHFGPRWLMSESVDPESFPSTIVAPLFEDMRIR